MALKSETLCFTQGKLNGSTHKTRRSVCPKFAGNIFTINNFTRSIYIFQRVLKKLGHFSTWECFRNLRPKYSRHATRTSRVCMSKSAKNKYQTNLNNYQKSMLKLKNYTEIQIYPILSSYFFLAKLISLVYLMYSLNYWFRKLRTFLEYVIHEIFWFNYKLFDAHRD